MVRKTLVLDERLPAYVRLRDTLAAQIARDVWTAEHPIPSEAALAREFGVSVGTVRKGVDGLVQEGVLDRRQGSGTFVRAPSFDATLFRFFQLREADGAQLSIPTSKIILRGKSSAPAEAIQALETDDLIKIVRLRSLSDQPVLFEEIYIPNEIFDGFEHLPEPELGPLLYPIYFERFGVRVKRATDELSFGLASAGVAQHLHLAEGDALAVIKRTAFDIEGKPIEWRIARGSAMLFRYRSDIG
ncbi:GntR family transcriptional regulator [Epibacterium ulvae]|uniref:GntR family transcriptional regulator n=1 Tax=Epibacterium ulvae TaxID=1156985 RepID=UPI002491D84C|nr:GntR family transcriptional regulator [Epibacterium ulvae]